MCVECVPRKVSLLSTPLVHTPGILAACQNDYKCKSKKARERALNIMKSWQNDEGWPFDHTLISLLKGEIPFTTRKEYDEKSKMELEHVDFEV